MKLFTNVQAAKKLGISAMSLGRYVKAKKVPTPTIFRSGGRTLHGWTEEEIEHLRKLLPKIANGRKTRYEELRGKQRTTKTQPRAAAVRQHKKK